MKEKLKAKKKLKVYFSMDPDSHELFEKHIDENVLDKSKLIEKLIEEYMKKKCCEITTFIIKKNININ